MRVIVQIFRYCTISFKSAVTRHAPPCWSGTLVEVTHHLGLSQTSKWSHWPQIA
jgi:hypothetical protein